MKPNPESLDGKPSPKRYRWWRFIEHSLPVIVIYLMVATLVSFLIAPNVIVTVPTGHVGILWKRFRGGTQLEGLSDADASRASAVLAPINAKGSDTPLPDA